MHYVSERKQPLYKGWPGAHLQQVNINSQTGVTSTLVALAVDTTLNRFEDSDVGVVRPDPEVGVAALEVVGVAWVVWVWSRAPQWWVRSAAVKALPPCRGTRCVRRLYGGGG